MDPTLDSCCARDAEERKQAEAWKAELHRNDPVEQRWNEIKKGGALKLAPTQPAAACGGDLHGTFQATHGVAVEADECNLFNLVANGTFTILLACAPRQAEEGYNFALEEKLVEYLEGFDAPILIHRFRPHTNCRSKCLISTSMRLPALLCYSQNKQVLVMERNRLEAESESALLTKLSHLKRVAQAQTAAATGDGEDEPQTRTGRNNYFQCEKAGCARTFHHVHVKSQYKYEEQQASSSQEEEEED